MEHVQLHTLDENDQRFRDGGLCLERELLAVSRLPCAGVFSGRGPPQPPAGGAAGAGRGVIAAIAATAGMRQLHPSRQRRIAAALLAAVMLDQPRGSPLQVGCRPLGFRGRSPGRLRHGHGPPACPPFPCAWRED